MKRDPEAAFSNITAQLAEGLWSAETDFGSAFLTPEFLIGQLHTSMADLSHMLPANLPDGLPLERFLAYIPYKQFGGTLDSFLDMTVEERRNFVEGILNSRCTVQVSDLEKCVDKDGNPLGNQFGCPTWKQYGVCPFAFNDILWTGVMSGDVPTHLMPGAMVDLTKRLGSQFGLIGRNAGFVLQFAALWPGKATYPGIGSEAKPLIMSTTEDAATGFKWTQEMKMAFPFGKLLTFQGFFHGFHSPFVKGTKEEKGSKGEWECFVKVQSYMRTGVLPRNGFVCHVERFGIDRGNPAAQSLVNRFSFLEATFARPS